MSFMTKMETVFIVLTKQDAIESMKALCGDKDPEVAKKKQPGRYTHTIFCFIFRIFCQSFLNGQLSSYRSLLTAIGPHLVIASIVQTPLSKILSN